MAEVLEVLGLPATMKRVPRGAGQVGRHPHASLLQKAHKDLRFMKRLPTRFTTKTNVADLIPSDVYSALFLEAVYAKRQLAGVVAAVEENMTAKEGDTVQVPFIDRRTLPAEVNPGVEVTAAAMTVGTKSVALKKWGDRDTVEAEVWEDQRVFTREDFFANMAAALGEKIDQICYDELKTATPGRSNTLAVAGTLTDLYSKIADMRATLLKDKVKPTDVIVGPDQEAQFLKDTDQGIKESQIQVQDGRLVRMLGMNVIVTPLANANANTAGMVQAIVIDRSRSLGEAWGRRPDLTSDYVNTKDVYELVMWARYNAAELKTDGIGHVKNP